MEHLMCRPAKSRIPPPTRLPLAPQPDLKSEGGNAPLKTLYRTRLQAEGFPIQSDRAIASLDQGQEFAIQPIRRRKEPCPVMLSTSEPIYREVQGDQILH